MHRRKFLATTTSALLATRFDRGAPPLAVGCGSSSIPRRPVPTASQLAWQRDERALFLHFGVNTFTDREWGDGTEDPAIFDPKQLDARQWARTARAAGFRAMILTAKHHDGFCLWPTRTTSHSVSSSPWRSGSGDVVREFVDACRAESLGAGVYLSPWDRNAPVYGDSSRYNDFYIEQLTELLTRYGPITEVWFDGANGEGPNGRRQVYDWPRIWGAVRRLQPNAVIFSDAGPDIRWIGNERGVAGDTNWSTVDPDVVQYPGASGDAVTRMLREGDPNGSVWRPGETDVSIRPGWFNHAAEDARLKSVDDLVSIYYTSVGHNSKLLLNVPPTREGLLHDSDVARLTSMRSALDSMFAADLAAGHASSWTSTGPRSARLDVDFGRDVELSIADMREDVTHGQLVSRFSIVAQTANGPRAIVDGTTIGFRRLARFDRVTTRRVQLSVDALEAPQPVRLALYA